MTSRSLAGLAIAFAVLVAAPACQRDLTDLEEAEFPGNAEIFVDGYAEGVTYQAFAGSKTDAVSVDQTVFYQGSSSLRIEVPVPTDPGGSYAGGAFTTNTLRDLTEYNAVTFWARASMPAELNVAGLGNNNTGESLYSAETANLQLTTDWQQYAIPFPLPSKLDQEDGLFFFAEGAEEGNAYTFWIDELQFANLSTISNPRPLIADQTVSGAVGDTVTVSGTSVTYEVSGQDITVAAAPAYFDYTSSDESVATVDELGQIVILADGTADITASMGSVAATGTVTVTTESGGETGTPEVAAPAPPHNAGDVISLFSDAYTDVPVDRFITTWSVATLTDTTVAGDAVKKYSELDVAGIEFPGANSIDASGMTHISMDVWTPNATAFSFKLVDFGADNAFGGGDDSENALITFDAASTPALVTGSWVSIDVPLSELTAAGLGSLTNLSQMVIVSEPTGAATVWVDNIYFYNDAGTGGAELDLPITFDDPAVEYVFTDFGDAGPTTLVEDPTDASNTVARTVKGTAAAAWAGTTMTDTTGLASPIPFTASSTTMTVRVYSPDAGIPVRLKVENAEDPTQSVETEATTTVADAWETLTFDFSNEATGTAALNLDFTYDLPSIFFNFGTDGATAGEKVYLWDDVEFGGDGTGGGPTPPAAPAPDPTQDAADVISIYSDSYTDVPNEGYALYGAVAFSEVDIAGSGNSALNYVLVDVPGGNFGVLELGGANQIDAAAAGMTNFRFDLYFPNELDASSELLLKLVDIAGDPATEAAITVDASSSPAIAQGTWLSFDFTLTELESLGLGGTSNIQQVVVDLVNSGEVYLDNIFFYAAGTSGGAELDLPITFDDPAVDYVLADFGGTASTLVADPTDASNTVAETVKSAGAETWAGTTMSGDGGLASPIPFTASATTMTVRVYSPDAGIPVRLKVEDAGDPTRSVETEATTTVANAWETLTFDFSNEATGTAALNPAFTYDKASIFFNFGTDGATAGEKIYLWDDVEFAGGGTGGSTEPMTAAPAPTQAEADVISMFSDAYTDVPVDTWRTDWSEATLEDVTIDGSAMKKYSALDFVGIETASSPVDASTMTHLRLDLWTPDATFFAVKLVDFGADGAFGGGDDTEHQINFDGMDQPAPAQGEWVSLDIPLSDFAGLAERGHLGQMILVGQPTGATSVFVDNIYFYSDSGIGGAELDLPITFDDPAVDYVLADFGGTASTLVADPTDASNTVAETVKSAGAETWAGTTMSGDGGLASAIPFTSSATTMTVRVYSPDAGIPVRLKVEDAADPTHSVETEATTTVANAWETLTFDFSNEATGTAALNPAFTYDKASIFFNFGTDGATAGEKIYLWDDVTFSN